MSLHMKIFLTFTAALVLVSWGAFADGQRTKACKNLTTGEIIIVEVGYPCPYPTTEI